MEVNIIPKFLDTALTPVAKEIGEGLADIISILFTPVVKAKYKRDKNIELFLKELDDKICKIPENQLQEPPLNIVGPTLDFVFKFYHDEEQLRHMYSSLIASSMVVGNRVHPSYIDIIRQLSCQDAIVLNSFLRSLPYLEYVRYMKSPHFFLELSCNCGSDEVEKAEPPGIWFYLHEYKKAYFMDSKIQKSLESLQRLGLVYFKKEKPPISVLNDFNIELIEDENNSLIITLLKVQLTNFGCDFVDVCCDSAGTIECLKKNDEYVKKIIMNKNGFSFSQDV